MADQQAAATQRADVTEYGLRRILIVAGVMMASLMQTLDTTITNVALPNIQGNLGASQDEGTWVVTAYTIAAIIVIPLTPWLQNRFGRKNYFVASIIGFTVASVMCGASDNLYFLIISRVIQGMFGGGLLATAQAILRDTFPPKQLGVSQGIFALGAIMGPALGPPIGIMASILLLLFLKDPTSPRKTPVDIVGLILLSTTLSTLQYFLTEGERKYWLQDPSICATIAIFIISAMLFVWWELTQTDVPIVDLRIFKNRSVAAGSGLALALGGAIFGSTYTLPQVTQGPLGYTPTLSGMLFLLRAIPIAIMTPLVVRFAPKIDTRYILGIGFLLVSLGCWLQAEVTTESTGFWAFAAGEVAGGGGAAVLLGANYNCEGGCHGESRNAAGRLDPHRRARRDR